MATIIITGGTGLIGTAVAEKLLEKGYKVIILSRKKHAGAKNNLSYAEWDVEKGTIDENAIRSADAIIHLAGAGVADKRWTKNRKKEIRDSRIKSGELLVQKLKEIPNNIRVVVSASAIGWYGPDPQIPNPNPFKEDAPSNDDFLGTTCRAWEASIAPLAAMSKRLVILRTGIVFSDKGGALVEFKKSIKGPFVPILGSGKQVVSWIAIDDLVNMYLFALENDAVNGIYNAVGPTPVSNRAIMMKIAGKDKGRTVIPIPVPAFALRLVLGEMSIEVLKSTTVSCEKIVASGFRFVNREA